jgi:hypothetical protein
MIDIKTALTQRETDVLISLSKDKNVLEIGSLLGYSTIAMAQVGKMVVSIDPHIGYPFYNPSPTLPIFLHNLIRFGVSRRVIPIINFAQNVLKDIKDSFDFVFIDATGFYEDTKFCLENSSAPTLAVHDFRRQNCDGVDRAVLEYIKIHKKQLTTVDTLAIIS